MWKKYEQKAVVLPKCSLVLRRVMSRVSIPSTMDTSESTSKQGGLDTTGTPNLNQCVRLKLKFKKNNNIDYLTKEIHFLKFYGQ